jgi:hypothetical protein
MTVDVREVGSTQRWKGERPRDVAISRPEACTVGDRGLSNNGHDQCGGARGLRRGGSALRPSSGVPGRIAARVLLLNLPPAEATHYV